jgi:hypothetical protein
MYVQVQCLYIHSAVVWGSSAAGVVLHAINHNGKAVRACILLISIGFHT